MRAFPLLVGSVMAVSVATPRGLCQILAPVPPPEAPRNQNCMAPNTSQPSAAGARCQALANTSGFMDSGLHFYTTMGALGGYDSAVQSKEGLSAAFAGGVLYTGVLSQRTKTFTLFENTASGLNYHFDPPTILYLDSASFSVAHRSSARSVVGFNVNNIYGNDALRVIQLDGSNVNVEALSYGIYAGRVLDNQATLRWSRQSTQTRWLSVSVRNNFRYFIDGDTKVNTVHGRVQLQFQPSPRAGIGLYEETSVQSGATDCSIQSLGVVYERRFSQKWSAEAAAAPAFGTKGCGETLTANFYGSVSAQPTRSSNLWVAAYRKLNDSWYAPLTFENNVQGGWLQRFGLHDWLRVQGGWIGGTVPSQVPSFNGEYVAASYGRRLGRGFTAALDFQHFNWSGLSSIAPTRTFVSAGIYWSPNIAESDLVRGPMAH